MAASVAYGSPSVVRAARARPTGRALASTAGKKPSTSSFSMSARASVDRMAPPSSLLPRPGITTDASLSSGDAKSCSLAARLAWMRAPICQASRSFPSDLRRWRTA